MCYGISMFFEKRVRAALESSNAPWWEWDIGANRVSFHDSKVTNLGYRPEDFRECGFEGFTELIHPDDHARTMEAMRAYLSGRAPIYRVDYRIRRADGSYTWYIDRGYAVETTDDGAPAVLRGFVFDVGETLEGDSLDERIVSLVRSAFPPPGSVSGTVIVVCAGCKRLKLSPDEWVAISEAVETIYPENLSHGICPVCLEKLYPEYVERAG